MIYGITWWRKFKLLYRVMRLIFSPAFHSTFDVVREVAHTPNMNNGKAWGEIGRYMGQVPGVGENVYRKLLADQKLGEKVERVERDLLIQLAYYGYKKARS